MHNDFFGNVPIFHVIARVAKRSERLLLEEKPFRATRSAPAMVFICRGGVSPPAFPINQAFAGGETPPLLLIMRVTCRAGACSRRMQIPRQIF